MKMGRGYKVASDEALLAAYRQAGSVAGAGRLCGIHGSSAHERLVRMGATRPVRAFTEAEAARLRAYYEDTPEAVFSLHDLASEMGRTRAFLSRKAKELGLTDRRRPASAAELLKNRPSENTYSAAKRGRREDLGGIYFRSGWEANYARYLNWLQQRGEIDGWEYEPETFWFEKIRRGVRSYLPDFRVHEKGRTYYVEIKGYMDPRSKTKLNRMRIYHPTVEVRVVARKEYAAIRAAVGRLIPNWEGL